MPPWMIGCFIPKSSVMRVLIDFPGKSSGGKRRTKHRQAALRRVLGCFVLDHVPVLGQLAVFEAQDVDHNPVRRLSDAREAAVEQNVIAVGDEKPVLVTE